MPEILNTGTATSANAYADLVEVTVPDSITQLAFKIRENDVNAIKYKILGSLDGTNYDDEIKAETVVNKNANDKVLPSDTGSLCADPWLKVKVQIASNVADTHGNVTATVVGS